MANPTPEAAATTPPRSDIFTASDLISNLTSAYQNWLNAGKGTGSRDAWLQYQEARKTVLNLIVKGLRVE